MEQWNNGIMCCGGYKSNLNRSFLSFTQYSSIPTFQHSTGEEPTYYFKKYRVLDS
jgi:hypothetical protein